MSPSPTARPLLAIALASIGLGVLAIPASARWTPPVDLSTAGSIAHPPCHTGQPSVAAAPDGSYLVAWQRRVDDDGGPRTVMEGRRIASDGTPGPLLALSEGLGNVDDALVAVGPDGAGIVVWHELPGGECGRTSGPILLQARRVGADGALGQVTPVAEPPDKALRAAVTMHASGDATVAWIDQPSLSGAHANVRQLPLGGPPGPVSQLTPTLGVTQDV